MTEVVSTTTAGAEALARAIEQANARLATVLAYLRSIR